MHAAIQIRIGDVLFGASGKLRAPTTNGVYAKAGDIADLSDITIDLTLTGLDSNDFLFVSSLDSQLIVSLEASSSGTYNAVSTVDQGEFIFIPLDPSITGVRLTNPVASPLEYQMYVFGAR